MATSFIEKATKSFQVDTGISGVTAWRSGNMVTLSISCPVTDTSSGWKTIGTLPLSLKPYMTLFFCGFNNDAESYDTNVVQDCRLIHNGEISTYLYTDHLNINLRATITYSTEH